MSFRLCAIAVSAAALVFFPHEGGAEEGGFARDAAPAPPSTSGEAAAAFDPWYVVPLRIHVLEAEELPEVHSTLGDAEIRRRVRGASRIWRQAGVALHIESIVREPAARTRRFRLARELGASHLGVYQWLRPEGNLAPNAVDVFFFASLPVNGVYFGAARDIFLCERPRLNPVRGGTRYPPERVLAHEIGHFLGLGHTGDPERLMASGTSGWRLDPEEIETARKTAASRPEAGAAADFLERADALRAAGRNAEASRLLSTLLELPLSADSRRRAEKLRAAIEGKRIRLRDGDRVAIAGGGDLLEALRCGSLEATLRSAFVGADIRWGFFPLEESQGGGGREALLESLKGFRPTAIVWVCRDGTGGDDLLEGGLAGILDPPDAGRAVAVRLAPGSTCAPHLDTAPGRRPPPAEACADVVRAVECVLSAPPSGYEAALDVQSGEGVAEGAEIVPVSADARGAEFELRAARVPALGCAGVLPGVRFVVRVRGLEPGLYRLRVGGGEAARATAAGWARGVELSEPPEAARARALRDEVLRLHAGAGAAGAGGEGQDERLMRLARPEAWRGVLERVRRARF